ncbi:MAG: bifunctional alpha/beta hydrolase/OsmC family protein [Pseudomonadota bacterium]
MDNETLKIEFPGSMGTPLAAALEMPAHAPRAFVLFAHCFSCSKDIKAAREIGRAMRAEGFAVLRFDFTGLGASAGDFANTNFSSNVNDLVAAADYLRAHHQAPSLLIGHSLSGAAVISAAREILEVRGVVTIGAPAHADHVLAHVSDQRAEIERTGEATVQLSGRPFTIKKQFLHDLENQQVLEHAATLARPLLVLHAPRDMTVGIENASALFGVAKHPKSFVSLDNADHLLSTASDARYAASVIAAWARRYLPDQDDPGRDEKIQASTAGSSHGVEVQLRSPKALTVDVSIGGHRTTIDASQDEGGGGFGPNPTRTLEAALAACAVMTMKMYANRKDWPLEQAVVRVAPGPGEDTHLVHRLQKTITLTGALTATEKARLLEIADKCPVHRMLTNGVDVETVER